MLTILPLCGLVSVRPSTGPDSVSMMTCMDCATPHASTTIDGSMCIYLPGDVAVAPSRFAAQPAARARQSPAICLLPVDLSQVPRLE